MINGPLPSNDREFLEEYCRDELTGGRISRERQVERRRILDRHAMAFAISEIQARYAGSSVVDANIKKVNNPGFDILVDDQIRVQVKGRCWIELIDFAVPPLAKPKAWASDVWLVVDFAGLIDGRHGKYAASPEMAPNGRVDAYVMPTELLLRMAETAFATSKRPRLRAIKPGSKFSQRHHMPELFDFRDRWEFLDSSKASGEACRMRSLKDADSSSENCASEKDQR